MLFRAVNKLAFIAIFMTFLTSQVAIAQGFRDGSAKEREMKTSEGLSYSPSLSRTTSDDMQKMTIEVNVTGAIARPGTYHIPILSRVTDALLAAEGILPEGSRRAVEIRSRNKTRSVDTLKFSFQGALSENPYLQDADLIYVPFKEKAVRIHGAVRHQGEYDARFEKTVGDLVDFLGGYSSGYDPQGKFYISRLASGETQRIEVDAEHIRDFPIESGDIIVVPHATMGNVEFFGRSLQRPGEQLVYPDLEATINVIGGVIKPGAYPFVAGSSAREYIAMAGGYRPLAIHGEVRVIKPGMKPVEWEIDDMPEGTINPGDTVEIRERVIPPQFWVGFMATLASIGLSAVAIFTR